MSEVREVPIADIVIGRRCRVQATDVLKLADSIEKVGLLHPVVLNSRLELIAGFRRIEAFKKLGRVRITARVVAAMDDAIIALRAELQENTNRVALMPTEMAEIGERIEALERPKAKQRLTEAGRVGGKGSGKLPDPSKGQTRDKVGAAVGTSGKTYQKIRTISDAAATTPAVYGDLPQMMDERSVDAAHKELKRRQAAVQPEPTPTPVVEPFSEPAVEQTAVADPAPFDLSVVAHLAADLDRIADELSLVVDAWPLAADVRRLVCDSANAIRTGRTK